MNKKNIIILGPTASGKTKLSIDIAQKFNLPIINVDSRQFWKDIKILTASPNMEELNSATHLMFNYLYSNEKPSLGRWIDDVKKIEDSRKIIVGGNGFYINSLRKGIVQYESENINKKYTWDDLYRMDPNTKIHPNDDYKIQRHAYFYDKFNVSFENYDQKYTETLFIIAIIPEKTLLYERIVNRAQQLINDSICEVKNIEHHDNYNNIIGYQEIQQYIKNEITEKELYDIIILRTYQYAKKQIKFINIVPVDIKVTTHILTEELSKMIENFLYSDNVV